MSEKSNSVLDNEDKYEPVGDGTYKEKKSGKLFKVLERGENVLRKIVEIAQSEEGGEVIESAKALRKRLKAEKKLKKGK